MRITVAEGMRGLQTHPSGMISFFESSLIKQTKDDARLAAGGR